MEQMEQDSPVKNGTQPDESNTEITMAEVNALRLEEEEPKKEAKLDDLFADIDSDDDEFPSTGRTTQSQVPPTSSPHPDSSGTPELVMPFSTAIPMAKTDHSSFSDGVPVKASASDPEVLRSFYQRLFPWRYLFQWLNHSPTPTNDFAHREFAFTLPNDAVWRYQSFQTADLYASCIKIC